MKENVARMWTRRVIQIEQIDWTSMDLPQEQSRENENAATTILYYICIVLYYMILYYNI